MAVRGDSLYKSMSSYLIEQISKISNIEVRLNTTVQHCAETTGCSASPLLIMTGGQQVVDCGHSFVYISAAPLTDWLPESLVRDSSGFVVTTRT